MDSTVDHIQLKRAWQTAFELRTCPDGATLIAEPPDEQLQRHLRMCHVCREKRELPADQRDAWSELLLRFGAAGQKPATPTLPVPGQVWSLHRSLAGWGKDGYYYQPPRVLLLEKIEDAKGFRAVQLSSDRYLMAEGDVWLDDRFGFAEGWNCYSVHEKALAGCWGVIADGVLAQVLDAVEQKQSPVAEDSILYFFRRLEISVGARVALPSVAVLIEETAEEIVTVKELVQGVKLQVVRSGELFKERILTVFHDGLEAISDYFTPALCLVERLAADELKDNSEIKILSSEASFQYVPTGIYVADGNAHIIIKFLAPCEDKPQVIVTFRNVSIDSKHISWNGWDTINPEIVIFGVTFTHAEEKKANPLLVMHVREGSTIFEIMPELK